MSNEEIVGLMDEIVSDNVIMARQPKGSVKRGIVKKVSKNKLSENDKVKILELATNNNGVAEIAAALQKTEKVVEDYLAPIKEALILNDKVQIVNSNKISDDLFEKVLNRLSSIGLERSFAISSINNLVNKLSPEEVKALDEQSLYNAIISVSRIKLLMINRTAGGRGGVSIMTEQASSVIDTTKPTANNRNSNSIYRSH